MDTTLWIIVAIVAVLAVVAVAGALKRRRDIDRAQRRTVAEAHRQNAGRSEQIAARAGADAQEKARLAERAQREAERSAQQAAQQHAVATTSRQRADQIDPDSDTSERPQ